jgi:hypothetical protein
MRRAGFELPTAVIQFVCTHEPAPDFLNVFRGARRTSLLLVTAESTYALRGVFAVRADWIVRHRDLIADAYHARSHSRGHLVDEVILPIRRGAKAFRIGFSDPHAGMPGVAELAKYTSELAVWEINEMARPDRPPPDPSAIHLAGLAYERRDFPEAFVLYAEALDHALLTAPAGPVPAAVLRGLTEALLATEHAAPPETPLPVDVEAARDHVVDQLHRLIATADDPAPLEALKSFFSAHGSGSSWS